MAKKPIRDEFSPRTILWVCIVLGALIVMGRLTGASRQTEVYEREMGDIHFRHNQLMNENIQLRHRINELEREIRELKWEASR